MDTLNISYKQTNKFSNLVTDYVSENEQLSQFINHFPNAEGFKKQLVEKSTHKVDRLTLVEVLKEQNKVFPLSDLSVKNIALLKSDQTFTVTTGHQLCLFTGPLYFIYKIISTLNLAEQLAKEHPDNNFVPVFWMATEDHDFQEINHINLFGKTLNWDSEQGGAVGRMNLQGFESVLEELEKLLGERTNASTLITIFKEAYLKHTNLADATRYLVNYLFGEYGLVIIDGDDKALKTQFTRLIKKDVLEQGFESELKKCSIDLAKNYKAQAYVRPINFFKLTTNTRDRIEGGITASEIENSPEDFSPNVLLRPLYQETILPNIAYVGGGAEVAYWMQLKTVFKQEQLPFPILLLRNSAMFLNHKQHKQFMDLGFNITDLFLPKNDLINTYIKEKNSKSVTITEELSAIEAVYQKILAKTTDVSIQSSIKAALQKQYNVLEKVEKKLLKSEKKKHETALLQIEKIKQDLFPKDGLQERYNNFIPFYLTYGENFIKIMKENLNPLNPNFVVLTPKIK